jgi:hypothetical protein
LRLEKLSEVFQDSVSVTRGLGLLYLWIDSLYIIQDDVGNLGAETGGMAQIHSQALNKIELHVRNASRPGYLDWPAFTKVSESLNSTSKYQSLDLAGSVLHYGLDQVHRECREVIKSEGNNPQFGSHLDSSQESSFYNGWLTRISHDFMPKSVFDSKLLGQHGPPRTRYDSWYGTVQEYT